MARSKRPTIRDVAARAGVSVKTVSRVLGDSHSVKPATAEHVRRVMAAMEYTPSAAAQNLRGDRTGVLGLVSDALTTTPDSYQLVRGVQEEAAARDMTLMIGETNGTSSGLARVLDTFRRQRVDAIVRASMYHRELPAGPVVMSCPFVLLNSFEAVDRYPTVLPDERSGGRLATEQMLALGHRRIAAITLPPEMVATRLRLHGYHEALAAAGLVLDPELVGCGVDDASGDEFAPVANVLARLLALPHPPTALLCGNDKLALRVLMVLASRGVSVPGQVSVVGYDDYTPIAETCWPHLSTVELPYEAMGRLAAKAALDGTQDQRMLVGGRWVPRASTAPPPDR